MLIRIVNLYADTFSIGFHRRHIECGIGRSPIGRRLHGQNIRPGFHAVGGQYDLQLSAGNQLTSAQRYRFLTLAAVQRPAAEGRGGGNIQSVPGELVDRIAGVVDAAVNGHGSIEFRHARRNLLRDKLHRRLDFLRGGLHGLSSRVDAGAIRQGEDGNQFLSRRQLSAAEGDLLAAGTGRDFAGIDFLRLVRRKGFAGVGIQLQYAGQGTVKAGLHPNVGAVGRDAVRGNGHFRFHRRLGARGDHHRVAVLVIGSVLIIKLIKMGLNCITGNQFDVVVAEGYRIGSGAGKGHTSQTIAAIRIIIPAGTARSQDQITAPETLAACHGHRSLGSIRGKRTFVQHHGIFRGNLSAHGDVVGFRSKIVGEVIVLFIVQDQPDHIAVFQAVCRNIQRNVAGLLSQLASNPFVAVHTAFFHRAQESVHCSDAGIAADHGKGDLDAVRRQSPLGRDGKQRGRLGCGHRYRLGLRQLAVVGQECRQFFSGGQRIRECQGLLTRSGNIYAAQIGAVIQQAVCIRRTRIILFQQNTGTLRNLAAQLHAHAGVASLGRSLNGHCGDIFLRCAGNQHRIVRTMEHGFIVVALGQEDALVLLPVDHGADTPPRLQGLRQRHLIVLLWLREDQVGG